jgi:hypothetical protein
MADQALASRRGIATNHSGSAQRGSCPWV